MAIILLFAVSCVSGVRTPKKSKKAKQVAPKEQPIRYIVIRNSGKVLLGNDCVTQYTREKFGFEYILMPDHVATDPSLIWLNNVNTKIYIFFRKNPFWKAKVKQRIRSCRASSGDFSG